jgi:holo-[acyl-carrier protein] synthase
VGTPFWYAPYLEGDITVDVRCGIDMIELDRIEKALSCNGDSFKRKVFTEKERDYCEARGAGGTRSYAVRFCAKEAVSKALGTGFSRGVSFHDIEIINEISGKPRVILHNQAKRLFETIGARAIDVSLTHSRDYAAAQAVIIVHGSSLVEHSQGECSSVHGSSLVEHSQGGINL